jgi:hypothetical protein
MENKIFKKEDKLFIKYKAGKNEEAAREVNLGLKDFDKEPEFVKVSVGITVCPKQFESLRVDYCCQIHHRQGQEYRDEAFELAKYNCTERCREDILSLQNRNEIGDHFLSPKGQAL